MVGEVRFLLGEIWCEGIRGRGRLGGWGRFLEGALVGLLFL